MKGKKMTVINEIAILELDGEPVGGEVVLIVSSHWNGTTRVDLKWGNGNKITVSADELTRAILNAQNHK